MIQGNGRVWITERNQRPACIDAAPYAMILNTNNNQLEARTPSVTLLQHVSTTCAAQQQAYLEYHVHWYRHILACLLRVTGATFLFGASAVSAVAYNPHYQFFQSPISTEIYLGAFQQWSGVSVQILLSFIRMNHLLNLVHFTNSQSVTNHTCAAEVWLVLV